MEAAAYLALIGLAFVIFGGLVALAAAIEAAPPAARWGKRVIYAGFAFATPCVCRLLALALAG